MDDDSSLPRRIGRYMAHSVIGRGSVGTVYRGLDEAIQRPVAIKVLRLADSSAEQRFLNEARVVGQLNHPNVALVFDFGRAETGEIYVVQEFVDGQDLARLMARAPAGLPVPVAVHLLRQVALALAHAHEQGIVHRDVKPGNVAVLASGVVKLLDFGIARVLDAPSDVTVAGAVVGTPLYMAPEAIMGRTIDQRADIYSFGVLAFEVLSGRKPYAADSFVALMHRILQEPAPSVRDAAPGCPVMLAELVQACMAKDPDQRPAGMLAVADAIGRLTSGWDPSLLLDDAAPVTPLLPPPLERTRVLGGDPFGSLLGKPTAPPVAPPSATVDPLTADFDAGGSSAAGGDLSGQTVGRFTLHERVARGHSGDLYKAYDPVRGDLVGVKVLHARGEEARQRLLRGGRIWIRLHHPNILRVHEVHPDYGGQPGVIVCDLIDGLNLEELAAQRHLGIEQVVALLLQLCDALAAIHARGVVHREVKPRNILVSGDELHLTLLDSGIARHANPEVDAFTKTGIFVGDLAYAAPEQTQGRVDQRTDVYAVVAVFFELVTQARLPFPAPAAGPFDAAALEGLPPRVRELLLRGLQRNPRARFSSVGELHDQLQSLVPGRRRSETGRSVIALHGIRTQAAWQRAFSEVAGRAGLRVHIDRWNFGYFSVLRFLSPWSRLARVRWFRATYQQEFRESGGGQRPSIVAHSFGTYILGNALLRYPYLRFDKVLLCGSILPTAFPWDRLIERGQVQAVRNEFGHEDVWTRAVAWFVPGTGPSGLIGFQARHPRFEQERFVFEHSEYFERGHMEERWLPHLSAQIDPRPALDDEVAVPPGDHRPWGLYVLLAALLASAAVGLLLLRR